MFNIKVDLIHELQDLHYQENQFAREYRQQLVSELHERMVSLNELDFRVRMVLDTVYTYRKLENWQNLTTVTSETIKKDLSPLLFEENKEDEMARRFDLWLFQIQLGQLLAKPATVHISQVMKTAKALARVGNIPQVFAQAEIGKKLVYLSWKKYALRLEIYYSFWINRNALYIMSILMITFFPLSMILSHIYKSMTCDLIMKKLNII